MPKPDPADRGFVAIDVPAFALGKPIILAVRLSDTVVVALDPGSARDLHNDGQLRGWEPYPSSPPTETSEER